LSVPFNVALGLVKKRLSFVDFTPAEQVWGQAHAIAVAGGSFRGPQTMFCSRRRDSGLVQP
jgi:hypothetical protein